MNECPECTRKQKRIDELERLVANMSRSADEVFSRIRSMNVVEFPSAAYAGRRAALREVPKR